MGNLMKFNFNGEYPEGCLLQKTKFSTTEIDCPVCTTARSRLNGYTTDVYLAEAILAMMGVWESGTFTASETGLEDMRVFLGADKNGHIYVEYQKKADANIIAVVVDEAADSFSYIFHANEIITQMDGTCFCSKYDTKDHKGTALMLALIPRLLTDTRFAKKWVDLKAAVNSANIAVTEMLLCEITNFMYYLVKDDKAVDAISYSKNVIADIEKYKTIDTSIWYSTTTATQFFDQTVASAKVWDSNVETAPDDVTVASGIDMDSIDLTLDPSYDYMGMPEVKMPAWYVCPKWVTDTATAVKMTHGTKNPVQNILLQGDAGSGKSMGSDALASLLGLCKREMSLGTDSGVSDILYRMIPNPNKGKGGRKEGVPTFDDIENDFENSFEKLFGRKPSRVDTPAMAYQKAHELMCEDEPDFIMTESDIMKGIRYGGVVEIQEANNLKRPAILEVLNPILAGNGFIELPTGEKVYRHPDCVFVFTINRGYEGTLPLQEAVLSRINLVRNIDSPSAEEMAARTKSALDFKDDAALNKMAKMVASISEYIKENDMKNGVAGPRELLDWATMATVLNGGKSEKISDEMIIHAAFMTVLQKAAQDRDDINDIIDGCFNMEFSPSTVKKYRSMI